MLKWAMAGWLLVIPSAADEPLAAPSDYNAFSLNHRCYAFLDVKNQRTIVFRQTNPPVRLWDMPGWFRVASLSDDCAHLVVGFDGGNLLPLDYKQDVVMLRFFERGRLVREVKLKELIHDFTRLRRTVSHFYWGYCVGFDERNRYAVKTVEGERIIFGPATGERLPASDGR